jgi:hypothetical protein
MAHTERSRRPSTHFVPGGSRTVMGISTEEGDGILSMSNPLRAAGLGPRRANWNTLSMLGILLVHTRWENPWLTQ